MIEFENVTKVYDDGTEAVSNLSFDVPEGDLLTLVGPSGCGKTTTMRMVNALVEPTAGEIYVDGEPLTERDPIELRRDVGYVIQEVGLFDHMSVGENVGIVPDIVGWDDDRIDDRVDELVDLVQLPPDSREKYPSELSGGQRQRVGVARALAAEPDILLMDEPFGALDPITREELQDEFLGIQEQLDVTIVFVTHDVDEALKMGDRVAVLRDGELVQMDTPRSILSAPKNEFVESFIGEDRLLKLLGTIPVREEMRAGTDGPRDGPTVSPDDVLRTAFQLILRSQHDEITVVEDGEVVGALSRADVNAAVEGDAAGAVEGDRNGNSGDAREVSP